MTRLRGEGPLKGSNARNQLAKELRARRNRKQMGLPLHEDTWTPREVAEMEDGDREFQKELDEIRRLKDRLLP